MHRNLAPLRGLEVLYVKDAGVFFGCDTVVRAREDLIELRQGRSQG